MATAAVTEQLETAMLQRPDSNASEPQTVRTPRVMLLDDEPAIIEVLKVFLDDAGYTDVVASTDASRAMGLLRAAPPDILITDLMMPEVNGFEILKRMREDPQLSRIPVIILTSYNDPENKLRALELGANDFLTKPVDPSELVLRMRNSFAIKHYQDNLHDAYQRSHRLLLGILPPAIAQKLELGETGLVDYFAEATVLYADLTGFTKFASGTDAAVAVQLRNHVFSSFDRLVEARGLQKIKTVGDRYMVVGGLTHSSANHASAVVDAGLAMMATAESLAAQIGSDVHLRVGAHTGPVVAGVKGPDKSYYDLWGDTVNVAGNMESTSRDGRFQISEVTQRYLGEEFDVELHSSADDSGVGELNTFLVFSRGKKRSQVR